MLVDDSQTASHPSELPTTELEPCSHISTGSAPDTAASQGPDADGSDEEDEGGLMDDVSKFLDASSDPDDNSERYSPSKFFATREFREMP
jgi:hypothetical protein